MDLLNCLLNVLALSSREYDTIRLKEGNGKVSKVARNLLKVEGRKVKKKNSETIMVKYKYYKWCSIALYYFLLSSEIFLIPLVSLFEIY